MRERFYIFVLVLSAVSGLILRCNLGIAKSPFDRKWVSTLNVGPVWAKDSDRQTFFLTPEIEKSYVPNSSTDTTPYAAFFMGVQEAFPGQWVAQLGLEVSVLGDIEQKGIIWDDACSDFDNHSYHYKIQNSRLMLKSVLLGRSFYSFKPWLSAGFGINLNRSTDFKNTPLIFEALPNENFANNTNLNFTYSLGAGVQIHFSNSWQLGVGYEFSDWGSSNLDRALGQTLNSGLKISDLYTHGLLINLTFLC